MHKIILTRGIQGSGKSTWAKKWVIADPKSRIRYNNDDMRNMGGVYWPSDKEALDKRELLIKECRNTFLIEAMKLNYDIVADNMNLSRYEWEYFANVIEDWNKQHLDDNEQYELIFKDFFDVSVEECIARDSQRPNPIGAEVIMKTWRKYREDILKELNK